MHVTLARAASGVATKRHRHGPRGEVVTEGYPAGESRWALYRRHLPDLPALAGLMREIPMDTCLLRGEPAAFVPPGSLTRRRLGAKEDVLRMAGLLPHEPPPCIAPAAWPALIPDPRSQSSWSG